MTTLSPRTAALINAYVPSAAHHVTEQDPMETVEFQTEHLLRNLACTIDEVAKGFRDSAEAREVVKRNRVRLLLAYDVLGRIVDKVEGKE